MNKESNGSVQHLYIVSAKTDSLVQLTVKNWLLQSEHFGSITEFSLEQLLLLPAESIVESIVFLFYRDEETAATLLPAIAALRDNDIFNPVLIIDFDSINLSQVREILLLEGTSVVSAKISGSELLHYLQTVVLNSRVVSKDIYDRILDSFLSSGNGFEGGTGDLNKLFSDQEQSILESAINGLSIRETADALGLSPNTVAVYRSRMIKKAGIRSFRKLLRP